LKIDLDAQMLDLIVKAMEAAQVNGTATIVYGKLLEKLKKGLEKEVAKLENANV